IAAVVAHNVISDKSLLYWSLGDKLAGTKYHVYCSAGNIDWDPETQYSTHGSPYVSSIIFQEMFEVD
ncbi:hypothetical protein HDU81_001654, partial [Chytriomyces hyalinus]